MAAAAGSSLDEGLGRLRELIDAAARHEPTELTGVRGSAPSVDGAALISCLGHCSTFQGQHPPSAVWVKPLLRHGIVPAVVGLLQHVLRTYRQSRGGFGIMAAMLPPLALLCGASSALVDGSEADDEHYSALLTIQELVEMVEAASDAFVAASKLPGAGSEAAAVRAAAGQLRGQLAAPVTLQALADAVRWVEAEAWPTERAMKAAAAGGVAQRGPAAGQGIADFAALQDLQRQCRARGVLDAAASVVRSAVIGSSSEAAVAAASASSSAQAAVTARHRALLAALRDSGVLSALSAAVLAAPPCPGAAPGAEQLDDATTAMGSAQYHIFSALWELTRTIAPWVGLSGATEVLAAPDVQRLRWGALEQLAYAGGGSGPGRAAAAEAGPRWLLLLQPHVRRSQEAMGGSVLFALGVMLGAALDVPARWLCDPQPQPGAGGAPSGPAAPLAAAKRLLPPPRRLAALAAACARIVCAEVEAELGTLAAGSAATVAAGPGGGGGGSAGADASTKAEGAVAAWAIREQCLSAAAQSSQLALIGNALPADGCLGDLLETFGWVLRAQAAAVVMDGGSAAQRSTILSAACAVSVVEALAYKLLVFQGLSAAAQAACVQRLLPTCLPRSLDCLLRRLAAAGLHGEGEWKLDAFATLLSMLASFAVTSLLRAHVTAPPAGGGGAWRAQDELGLLVTAAKLARWAAGRPGGMALRSHSDVRMRPLAQLLANGLADAGKDVATLLKDLAQWRGRGGCAAARERFEEAAAVLREALAFISVATLPILERAMIRDLQAAPGGGGGGGRGASRGAAPLLLRGQSHADVVSTATSNNLGGCALSVIMAVHYLAAAVQLLPPADLLALRPQRTLALLGRLLQRAHELRRPGAGQRGRRSGSGDGGRGTRDEGPTPEGAVPVWADEVAGALVHMAADEQLVGVVAGWLRREAAPPAHQCQVAEALMVQPQGLCGGLDACALAAALRHWNAAAADSVVRLQAAAMLCAPNLGAEGEGPGSDGGAAAPLLAAARAVLARRRETKLWGLRDGNMGGYPPWPPRLLRLCGNPACCNFDGPAEADLPLRKCSGCKGVRYCGAGCQGQHWREGGHKEACARLRAATEASKRGG